MAPGAAQLPPEMRRSPLPCSYRSFRRRPRSPYTYIRLTLTQYSWYNIDSEEFMYIYGLIDPRGPELFYVGRTAKPSARLRKHRYPSSDAGKKLRARVEEIKRNGGLPEMVILEQADDPSREYVWIQFFAHLRLVNTVRQPTVRQSTDTPRIRKTHEELTAICRESWKRKKQKFASFSKTKDWTLKVTG